MQEVQRFEPSTAHVKLNPEECLQRKYYSRGLWASGPMSDELHRLRHSAAHVLAHAVVATAIEEGERR